MQIRNLEIRHVTFSFTQLSLIQVGMEHTSTRFHLIAMNSVFVQPHPHLTNGKNNRDSIRTFPGPYCLFYNNISFFVLEVDWRHHIIHKLKAFRGHQPVTGFEPVSRGPGLYVTVPDVLTNRSPDREIGHMVVYTWVILYVIHVIAIKVF